MDAFWSLTLYNSKGFMVENAMSRYSIGDRSQGLIYGPDGSLTLYIQSVSPGENLEANWLPAPADAFNLTLRLYLPKPEAIESGYIPPPLHIN